MLSLQLGAWNNRGIGGEAAMIIKHPFLIAALATTLSFVACPSAVSRLWKALPDAIARDYARIEDGRSNGEMVIVMWFAPPTVRADAPGGNNLVQTLQKYTVILALHARIENPTGTATFEEINTLQARDANGKPLILLAREDLPPTTVGLLTTLEAFFRQSLGAMGKGLKTFVFNAGNVDACKEGQLSVPLAGEVYTWNTPFPGCARS
jgi:hypothetical protein